MVDTLDVLKGGHTAACWVENLAEGMVSTLVVNLAEEMVGMKVGMMVEQ